MAQVVYSRNAISNLDRLHRFLSEKNPQAAARAIMTILDRLGTLSRFPRVGRVDPERPDTRELFMPLGAAGYVARYRVTDDVVTVMAVRHMREAGYANSTGE
jgi:plasmid stabilization system protein ParE